MQIPQALSLLLAIILRSMVSTRKTEYDTEEEVGVRDRTREPLLNPPANQAAGAHFDLWGARMREKVLCSAMHSSLLRKGEGKFQIICF